MIPASILLLVFAANLQASGEQNETEVRPNPALGSKVQNGQITIPWVAAMPRLPEPLHIRDWAKVSQSYYSLVMNKAGLANGKQTIAPKHKKIELILQPVSSDFVRTPEGQAGWFASYYNGTLRNEAPILERIDASVDFNWKHEVPDPVLKRDKFTVRWEGILRPKESREYTFWMQADDGARVSIEDRLLFDGLQKPFRKSEKIFLRNDYDYRVVIDYIERSGVARVHFKWDYPKPDYSKMERVDFAMPSYLGTGLDQEIFTCLSPVVGARLMGQDLREQVGFDYVESTKNWFDVDHGVYRHRPGRRSPVLHSGIYGYWSSVYGMMLADLYPDDVDFQEHADSTFAAFLKLAEGMGCPDVPDFDNLGFNFKTGLRDGRNEPMNRLGNAPTVAWICLLGYEKHRNPRMLNAAATAMQWYVEHPGRYEATYLMAPITAARLNAECGFSIPMDSVLAAWFGDGEKKTHPWHVIQSARINGIDCAGLDGAKWKVEKGTFHAFTMGSLMGPSWLMPVVRYDQRYARSIARYGLNAANSMRLLQGFGLDWHHQDHKDWKDRWDPENLLFYEALTPWESSHEKSYGPYATGDPIKSGWGTEKVKPRDYLKEKKAWFSNSNENLALYMGNHIGFLGAICRLTEVPGVLAWDCLMTDWHRRAGLPTTLFYNPHINSKVVSVTLKKPTDLYDTIRGKFIARGQDSIYRLKLEPNQVAVLVQVPVGASIKSSGNHLLADGIVIDYRSKKAL